MSWDISITKFSRTYSSISEIGENERALPLGPREAVQRAVSAVFPTADWSDPSWGVWESDFGSIEFNLGKDPAQSMMLHVRAGAEVIPPIVQLCKDNGWQGIDCSSGDFVDQVEDPRDGLAAWTAYRDQVIGKYK